MTTALEVISYSSPNIHFVEIAKIRDLAATGPSTGRKKGEAPHPVNFSNAVNLMFSVSTHQTCISTKRDCIVGLGIESASDRQKRATPPPEDPTMAVAAAKSAAGDLEKPSKAHETLDPLCEVSFQSLLDQCGEDYVNTGNAVFEVVRDGTQINSLWHVPFPAVVVVQEEEPHNWHFKMVDTATGKDVIFARFGDVEGLRSRMPTLQQENVTELVHIKEPTASSAHYGIPGWLAVTPWLEMAQQIISTEFDYYQNRAVPDLIMFLLGRKMDDDAFKKLKDSVKETIGAGKRFRTLMTNIPDPEMKVQLERLQNATREKISDTWPTVEMAIVSAHRVPPLLAGIVTPGKMSAANELPNALVAFQTLYVGQHQNVWQAVLGRTLGTELGLTPEDFRFRRITDFYDIGQMDTMSRMKQPAAQAQAEGRKLADGLKK